MTEQQISKLFEDYRCLKAELAIMQVCSVELMNMDRKLYTDKYKLLERKIAVTDHLLTVLPHDERYTVQMHMMEGLPWSRITEMICDDGENNLPYDKRSLQRIKARALKRMHTFIQYNFENSLDFLTNKD